MAGAEATIDAARPNRERAFSHARHAIAWNMAARLKCCLNGAEFCTAARRPPLSSPDLIGRSSILETEMIKSRRRRVLDVPVKPGHDSGGRG
jgi:hypothetical protein